MLIRMHLSLLISMVSLGVATASYLQASRLERDQRHLRRRVRQLRLQLEAETRAEDQKQKAEERITAAGAFPRNGDRVEERKLSP
jgi:hypothetical protein